MPELPEVETIRNELIPQVVGRQFISVILLREGVVREPSPTEFCRKLAGRRVENINRRGKYLLFQLDNGMSIILHLKMTGVLLLQPTLATFEKHTAAVFRLSGGVDLCFIDQRKFGSVWLVKDVNTVIGKLGPEPLNASLTPAALYHLSEKRQAPIKALLCDQHAIAGIGNMYADEALFAARIHPLRKAGALSEDEVHRLYTAIVEVLERGIRSKGASTDTYRRPGGETGDAHSEFKVAHRRGEVCPRCHIPIQRIVLRGRGTYFCPECQPE